LEPPKEENITEAPTPPPTESLSSEVIRETNIPDDAGRPPLTETSSVVSLFYSKNFWIALLVVMLILSFLGVNFVMLLGQVFQPIVNVFWILITQILALFGYTTGTVLNKTVDVVSGTAKAGIDIAEGTVQSVGNLLIKGSSNVNPVTQSQIASNILGGGGAPAPAAATSTLDAVLNNSSRRLPQTTVEPDASTSAIQTSASWCFVGEMEGKRTCADVSSSNLCLSGQYYKTRDDCETKEGFTNGPLMMATPPPVLPPPASAETPGSMMQKQEMAGATAGSGHPPLLQNTAGAQPLLQNMAGATAATPLQAAPTGALVQLPSLGPPQYMGPPNFPLPGMANVQMTAANQVVGPPLLSVGPPNYIDFSVASQKQQIL
jgi:hypothetical protein